MPRVNPTNTVETNRTVVDIFKSILIKSLEYLEEWLKKKK